MTEGRIHGWTDKRGSQNSYLDSALFCVVATKYLLKRKNFLDMSKMIDSSISLSTFFPKSRLCIGDCQQSMYVEGFFCDMCKIYLVH